MRRQPRSYLAADVGVRLVGPCSILAKMFEQEVDETAHLRREMAAMGIDRVDRQLACPELCQDRNKTPRFAACRCCWLVSCLILAQVGPCRRGQCTPIPCARGSRNRSCSCGSPAR